MGQPYVGEIRMFAGNFAPAGWQLCQGQTLPISEYETIFNLIGTTYGGDGQNTFNLPDLQSRFPIHQGTGPDGTTYQIGEAAGAEQVTLSIQQIPNHNHTLTASLDTGTQSSPGSNVLAQGVAEKLYRVQAPSTTMNSAAIGAAGGSQPHDNMQPFLVINFIISLFGVFPSQS